MPKDLPPMMDFNPRTPCGVRPTTNAIPAAIGPFQSTHPLRGATAAIVPGFPVKFISIHAPLAGCDPPYFIAAASFLNFNPRTPCGVRREARSFTAGTKRISIHAPLAGCDPAARFLRRPPLISIHAPLAGCDSPLRSPLTGRLYFNPRTPCGVRLDASIAYAVQFLNFNPRTPCGVRLVFVIIEYCQLPISIHAPLAGCD